MTEQYTVGEKKFHRDI